VYISDTLVVFFRGITFSNFFPQAGWIFREQVKNKKVMLHLRR
jgi:hypothetical protein